MFIEGLNCSLSWKQAAQRYTVFRKFSIYSKLNNFIHIQSLIRYQKLSRCYSRFDQNNTISLLKSLIDENSDITNKSKKCMRAYWQYLENNNNVDKKSIIDVASMENFINFVNRNKSKSTTVLATYYRELLVHGLQNNFNTVNTLINKINGESFLIKDNEQLLSYIIYHSLSNNQLIVAVSLYLFYHKLHPDHPLNEIYSRKLIKALSFNNPKYNYQYLLKFLELDQLYKSKGKELLLTELESTSICEKALSMKELPILTNKILNKILDANHFPSKDKLRNDQLIAGYDLIHLNYKLNNPSRVFSTWTKIKNNYPSFTSHDPNILYKVLNLATHHKSHKSMGKEIIQQLPPKYYCNSQLIFPEFVDFATKSRDLKQAQKIISDVNKNIIPENIPIILKSKRCLSALLRMHLTFNDSDGVNNVLKQIIEVNGKISAENYQAIITHLIRSGKVDDFNKAVSLFKNLDSNDSLLSYPIVIQSLMTSIMKSESLQETKRFRFIVKDLLSKAHRADPKHLNSMWNIISSLYIKHLTSFKGFKTKDKIFNSNINSDSKCLDDAKLIYLNSISIHNFNKSKIRGGHTSNVESDYSHIDYNPFYSSDTSIIKLKITKSNRYVILKNIAINSIHYNRKDIFSWCCSELYQHGLSIDDLLLDWNLVLKQKIRSTEFKSSNEIEKTLSTDGLKSIKENLR
ncbi:hypothetical protein Kpol_2000p23 [Vanderwaltozyma polyspora DSM 70294]|uniref:Uncharacterized protein n=1 Tax=Vanderwaltozyma polyspora (strain ATCC 22028 / DSM 70294 / BCRC 21397 / CBS 2163 / NBRC 10782 / NRRL Y-8283 / UCD 57-17) TaxID=436907 RepID=A7TF34_VANPO|nr:uncharacterized protein Kpol_2000p23 [Vanderwaltozyma polyspora DSM 70294]EDO19059.1 hypothetical protein Kpol_2000p23 [Vanderwaltozyma polyspora DSM 70294]